MFQERVKSEAADEAHLGYEERPSPLPALSTSRVSAIGCLVAGHLTRLGHGTLRGGGAASARKLCQLAGFKPSYPINSCLASALQMVTDHVACFVGRFAQHDQGLKAILRRHTRKIPKSVLET